MSPTTTRSNQNTPTKSALRATPKATVVEESSPKVTPRKAPHCHKCQKPMRGHPKGACSSRDSPTAEHIINSINSLDITKGPQDAEDEDVVPVTHKKTRSTGRRSLTPRTLPAEEDTEPEDTKAVIRERRRSERAAKQAIPRAESLGSLDSNSVELLKHLLPEEEPEKEKKVVHWKDEATSSHGSTSTNGRVKMERAIMPCSLDPPSPWSSFSSVVASQDDHDVASSASSEGLLDSHSRAAGKPPKPLQRSMSMEERHQFLKRLEGLSSAQAYMIPEADSDDLQAPKGLFTKSLPAGVAHPGQNILIVGKDEKDTQDLYERLKEEQATSGSRRRSGGLTMAAGGVVVGAVATFAGLAY
ncbi:hypothetical protein E1B28_004756 [Marasmius oreades]|uniref:Uncharacterized protein n=1 Tax=Marasmius oreades TaxID=181124 RepID=A0A9P8AD48_9AGAR|nr:uncharacterized protein E1B28_004756 [Marasmius oreades]KAG7097406.1 hypothetical protein E1B28_004756 [Marasmius oreades]